MRGLFTLGFACAAAVAFAGYNVGAKVEDFSLMDTSGNTVQFDSLKGDTTVIAFIATECPVSNAYNERMKALYNEYSGKGVKFVFINSNHTEPADAVAAHKDKHGFPFPVYKDDGNVVADAFGAQVTPEIFVVDSSGAVRYHGPIDDSQNESRIQAQRLRSALDAMLAGKTVETAQSKAFGCTIKRKKTS